MSWSKGEKSFHKAQNAEEEAEEPWRPMVWKNQKKMEYMSEIKNYVHRSMVSRARVLLLGPVGEGKSSFFNSVNSVFKGHITSQALSGSSYPTGVTKQFRTYSLKAGHEGDPLPLVLCDTMGLKEQDEEGLHMADVGNILNGHVPDRYQFQPSSPISSETPGFVKSPSLEDRIHCVVYVIDVHTVCHMYGKLWNKIKTVRKTVNNLGIPQLVLLTKVDQDCKTVAEDISNVYRSDSIRRRMTSLSNDLGLPMSCILPVKNYSHELELNLHCDILLLSAAVQMLRFADNYLDDSFE